MVGTAALYGPTWVSRTNLPVKVLPKIFCLSPGFLNNVFATVCYRGTGNA